MLILTNQNSCPANLYSNLKSSHSSPRSPSPVFPILSLPGEIRTAIYLRALVSPTPIHLGHSHPIFSLPYTCRTIYSESIQLIYCLNAFIYALNTPSGQTVSSRPLHPLTPNPLFPLIRDLKIHLFIHRSTSPISTSTPTQQQQQPHLATPPIFSTLLTFLHALHPRPDITIRMQTAPETRALRRQDRRQFEGRGSAQLAVGAEDVWVEWERRMAGLLRERVEEGGWRVTCAWREGEGDGEEGLVSEMWVEWGGGGGV